MLYLDVAAIPFKVVTLCNDTPFPAFLPCLECLLIVLLFRRVKYHLRFALDLLHGDKTPALPAETLSFGRGRSRMEPNPASRVGVERRPCWCGPNTRVFLTHCQAGVLSCCRTQFPSRHSSGHLPRSFSLRRLRTVQ